MTSQQISKEFFSSQENSNQRRSNKKGTDQERTKNPPGHDALGTLDSSAQSAKQDNTQRVYDQEDLKKKIELLYERYKSESERKKEHLPKAKDFVTALKEFVKTSGKSADEIFNSPEFAWDLMKFVAVESDSKLHEQIKDSSKEKLSPIGYKKTDVYNKNWTLRHYTTSKEGTPNYREIKSTAELVTTDIKRSEHTNDADWNQIGNVGFSFYLLCIDGKVPNRNFLKDCTHYAEFDLSEIGNLFVSGDMLSSTSSEGGNKLPGFKGSGTKVKDALCNFSLNHSIDMSGPVKFLEGLDSKFKNFEVKVPGQLKAKEWVDVNKQG